MKVTAAMAQLRANLTAALPQRMVCQDFKDFNERSNQELTQGAVTLLLSKLDVDLETWESRLRLMLVGQLKIADRSTRPSDVEAAELALFQELLAWLRNPGAGLPLPQVHSVRFSSQTEHPNGWVSIELECGPFDQADSDDTVNYPPATRLGQLTSFHADIDVPPTASDADHQKWLQGDYSTAQPDLQLQQELR